MTRSKKSLQGKKAAAREASVAKKQISNVAGPSQPVDVAALIDTAHTLLAQSNFDLAIQFLTRALEHEPTNLEAREVLGIAELEEGDEDAGREHLLHLFPPHTPSPPSHPSPYLYLAQTASDPREALGFYSTAASIIENSLKARPQTAGDDERSEMVAMGVRAVLAMIEIWMSDLCMEPEAEGNCDSLISRAISISPQDAEVQLTLASIRMSQSRFEEAKKVVEEIYERISDTEASIEILQAAREEDSLEVESAYLEGWAFYLRAKALEEGSDSPVPGAVNGTSVVADANGQEAKEEEEHTLDDLSSKECYAESMRALIECADLFTKQDYPDEGIGSHLGELLDEMKAKGVEPALAEVEVDEEGDGGEGDGDWEDVEMK